MQWLPPCMDTDTDRLLIQDASLKSNVQFTNLYGALTVQLSSFGFELLEAFQACGRPPLVRTAHDEPEKNQKWSLENSGSFVWNWDRQSGVSVVGNDFASRAPDSFVCVPFWLWFWYIKLFSNRGKTMTKSFDMVGPGILLYRRQTANVFIETKVQSFGEGTKHNHPLPCICLQVFLKWGFSPIFFWSPLVCFYKMVFLWAKRHAHMQTNIFTALRWALGFLKTSCWQSR